MSKSPYMRQLTMLSNQPQLRFTIQVITVNTTDKISHEDINNVYQLDIFKENTRDRNKIRQIIPLKSQNNRKLVLRVGGRVCSSGFN